MKAINTIKRRLFASMTGANENEISLFDVKALYEAAYAEKFQAKASLRRFRSLLARAEKLDGAYRKQLAVGIQRLHGKAV